jgi:aspartate beta-hydroxylase
VNQSLQALVEAAGKAASQGRWSEAEQQWRHVLAIDPRHPQALYSLGVHAFKRGEWKDALHWLRTAHAVTPRDPVIALSISVVLREQGDSAGELAAIDAALAADPYFLAGLLARGAHMERHGQARAAVEVYRNALQVAPPEPHWPSALRTQLQHASVQTQRQAGELATFLAERIGARINAMTPIDAQRWHEASAILAGRSQPYPSVCSRLQVPRLPAIPFFERSAFAWVDALEASTDAIRHELSTVLDQASGEFRPYVAFDAGTPLNQWQELNNSRRWSSYFLWRDGVAQREHLQQCPATAAALDAVGMADIGGLCPNAMFSALAPHTRIPPHHGETNARVIVHLPLIVPDGCTYRVGFEQRRWKVGEVLIFDDSIEHEARNDGDELRVVLIFDVWNPLLSTDERDLVKALSAAKREFHAQR